MSLITGLIGDRMAGCPGHPGTLVLCDDPSLHQHSGPYFPYCIGLFWCEEEESDPLLTAEPFLWGGFSGPFPWSTYLYVCV